MRNGRRTAGVVAGVLLACCACASALDPSLDISQYAHTAWKIRDGFTKGAILAIAQTPDGYLWLGTEFGLLRFDGVRAVPWQPLGEQPPDNFVRSLLVSRDGTLWIATDGGLASWKEGKLVHYPQLRVPVYGLFEDRAGNIWLGKKDPRPNICAVRSGSVQCYGDAAAFGIAAFMFYEDKAGNLWVGATRGLWRWKPGPPKLYPMRDPVVTVIEDDNGALLIGTPSGIKQLVDGEIRPYSVPGVKQHPAVVRLFRDRDGSLWIGTTDRGLLHVHDTRTDVFALSDGLSGDSILSVFEDRESNIWVSTVDGLDRFRDFAVPTISVGQGLSSTYVFSVLAANDGSIWLGTANGLDRWKDGQITVYRKQTTGIANGGAPGSVRQIVDRALPDDHFTCLYQDDRGRLWVSTGHGVGYFEDGRFIPVNGVPPTGYAWSIAGDGTGDIWVSKTDGLFRLPRDNTVDKISWAELGRERHAIALLRDSSRKGLWLGFIRGGIAYLKDGETRASYTEADGLGKGIVEQLRLDPDGALWAATQGGLSRIKDGHISTLTSKNGLPCDTVHWSMRDDADSVWLYMSCGLVRIARPELDAWVSDPGRKVQPAVFDNSDGIRTHALTSQFSPLVTKSADGKLWFLPIDGVSVIDPLHLGFNQVPPPVHIEQVTADDKTYDATNGLRLPPHVRYLAIDYTALSLVAPEKVHFRYKLEGEDKDWREVVNDRQVQYTNLSPKNYRFRVLACNNSGVWNEQGASLEFVIPPAWYQTNWFYALCAATFLLMLWGLYRLRVLQLQREFNAALEARVGERTRVARDIHDTLLQSFHGLLLRFQTVFQLLPERPIEAKERLESAIDQAAEAITEGRDAVQGLRDSVVQSNDLALAISTLGEELLAESTNHRPAFRVAVEGESRDLHPIIRDEIYKVAAEALRNTFRHAQARQVEVEIRYDDRRFRLRVRDDGKGIDPKVLAAGREGHYGMYGMRERAEVIGGKLGVWSQVSAGTEVELTIPANLAYAGSRRLAWLTQRLARKESGD